MPASRNFPLLLLASLALAASLGQTAAFGQNKPPPANGVRRIAIPSCPAHCPCFPADDWKSFQEEGKFGFKDAMGNVMLAPQWEAVQEFSERHAPARRNGRWGMIDVEGNWKIEPKYHVLGQFHEGLAAAQEQVGEKYGFLGAKDWEIRPRYAQVTEFHEGLAGATENGKTWGYVDFRAKWIVEPQYEELGHFAEGLAPFRRNGKYGYLTRRNEIIIEPKYDSVGTFSAGSATVTLGGKTFDIDKWEQPPPAELALVKKEGKGKALPPSCLVFPRLLSFRVEGKTGFKRADGSVVTEPAFVDSRSFSEGAVSVQKEHWGLLDSHGRWLIEPQYRFMASPSEGLVYVKDAQGKVGLLDRQGRVVIPPRFASMTRFQEGVASASEDGKKWGLIDFQGKWVIEPKFDGVGICYEGIVNFEVDERVGFLSVDGELLLEPAYIQHGHFVGGAAKLDGLWRDRHGKPIER